jgi:transcriptional repressor NrdR
MSDGAQVRRRRECLHCNERFTTYEKIELVLPQIIKRNGQRESFNEEKLRRGLARSLEKRRVPADEVTAILQEIKKRLRSQGEREISSHLLGEWLMQILREVDQVAYVRFASVYRRFQDVDAFKDEIARMQQDLAKEKQ